MSANPTPDCHSSPILARPEKSGFYNLSHGGVMTDTATLTKYDRLRGGLEGVALFTKPSTVQHVQNLTGKTETFVVQSCRYEEHGGDYIFVQCVDEGGTT